jgi:hypothetical protein
MAGDLYFPKVAFLAFGNAFTDLSYNQSPMQAGPVTLTNAFPGVLNSSYWFQRTFTGITLTANHPASAVINVNEDFTVEVVAYCQRNNAGGALFSNRTPGGNAEGLLLALDANSRPFVRVSAGGTLQIAIDGPNKIVLDALHTFKVHRKNGIWGLSVDGVPQRDLRHQPRWTGEVPHGSKLYLGCDPYTTGFVGGINAVRLTVGEARQTGSYTPEVESWPIFATDPNVLFGPLSTDLTTRNASVLITLDVENAASLTMAAVDGRGANVGSGWAVVPNNISGQNNFKVTGTAPAALADYFLVFTATTTVEFGSLTRSQSYRVHNTAAGSLSVEQGLLASLGGARLWIDSSDSTTVTVSGSDVMQVINKIDSIPFTPALARPKPQLDTTAMAHNSIRFPENASSGLVAAAPIVLSSATSNSTIVLVGKYVGQALGQGAGLFQISYTDDDAQEDGTAAWILSTPQTGVTEARAAMYDSTFRQNGIGTEAAIAPGESFVVAWNTASNKADIWLQQRLMAEIEIAGTLDFWSSVNAAIAFIGGSQNPTGAFITMGELIALDTDLAVGGNESPLEQLISHLNHKWSIFPNVPFASTPSTLSGYVGNPYAAITILTDATSVSITANGGTDWAITPTGSLVVGEYLITGHLPSTPTTVVITLNSLNGSTTGVDDFPIQVLALPTTPVIQPPLNLQAQAGAGFTTLLNIFSADTVTVIGSAGFDWTIAPITGVDNGNYIINGIAPSVPGSFSLTIHASLEDESSGLELETTAVFTVVVSTSLVDEPDQYQVDLTGLLPGNAIVDERQTLTPANGVRHQLLIPLFAPYFGTSLVVHYYAVDGTRALAAKGVDYVSVMKQSQLSSLTDSDIFSGVLILNPQIRGTVFLNYQTLGGGFGVDRRTIMEDLALLSHRDKFAGWNAITGKPVFFPVADHPLDIQKHAVGFTPLVNALEAVRASFVTFAESDVVALNAHTANNNNPHAVTKAQVGLPNVQNYALASDAEAISGLSAQRYLTPHTASVGIDTHMPVAQDTVKGKFRLNLGDATAGDDIDNTKPLTGSGVVALLIDPNPNALNVLFASLINQAEQAVQAGPMPLVYPLWWKGVLCADELSFVNAVRSYTGLRALRFNSNNGVFYFPVDITAPSLTTYQSFQATGHVLATVHTPVALPLRMTD